MCILLGTYYVLFNQIDTYSVLSLKLIQGTTHSILHTGAATGAGSATGAAIGVSTTGVVAAI
jgi:hypothetical protein